MNRRFGSPVLEAACRLITPFVLLFAVYVVVHGHDSPGGGFQGGAIAAAIIILIRIVRENSPPWLLDTKRALICACSGTGLFVLDGCLDLLFGGNFLDYGALPLPLETLKVRFLGSFLVEAGVGIAVMGTLVLIYDVLSNGVSPDEDE